MLEAILNFLHMGGYAFYVWSAYGSVFILLTIAWFIPWQRWRKYKDNHEYHS
jgi:heme exporter protein CcmD